MRSRSRPIRWGPRGGLVLALLASATWLMPSTLARAWGRLGHRASARLAEGLLSPSARAAVRDLLLPEETLADAAPWADEIRNKRRHTGPWHYVDAPISNDHYEARFCNPETGCVVSKAKEMQRILADRSRPKVERREALRFLVHFIQDLHQPLHVGDNEDKGGNGLQVRFFTRGSNLHRVWDSDMLERAGKSDEVADEVALVQTLKALATPENLRKWSSGTIDDWAEESFQASKHHAYVDPSTGKRLAPGSKLGEAYQNANLPIAETRLAESGARIAWVLNEIFP